VIHRVMDLPEQCRLINVFVEVLKYSTYSTTERIHRYSVEAHSGKQVPPHTNILKSIYEFRETFSDIEFQ
jgi:hypothetical protein